MKQIGIVGSTGSIGVSALEVIRHHSDRFEVSFLTAGSNSTLLAKQAKEFQPQKIAIYSPEDDEHLSELKSEVLFGEEGILETVKTTQTDINLVASVGASGLKPAVATIENNSDLALANKESLVMTGELMTEKARDNDVKILPVDSEHSAIFQCLRGEKQKEIKHIHLTASGGPFWSYDGSLEDVTPKDALDHPTWDMGNKISIDSATMMNKGLEVIECYWLFDVDIEQIKVTIHPQSVLHSMVKFKDGSIMAHLGTTDMKIPIQFAFSYPDRLAGITKDFNLTENSPLEFHKPDNERFPALNLSYRALRRGDDAPAVLNAANEIAVEAFLNEKIGFTDIPSILKKVMETFDFSNIESIDEIISSDRTARTKAKKLIKRIEK